MLLLSSLLSLFLPLPSSFLSSLPFGVIVADVAAVAVVAAVITVAAVAAVVLVAPATIALAVIATTFLAIDVASI